MSVPHVEHSDADATSTGATDHNKQCLDRRASFVECELSNMTTICDVHIQRSLWDELEQSLVLASSAANYRPNNYSPSCLERLRSFDIRHIPFPFEP